MTLPALKPCPFCGNSNTFADGEFDDFNVKVQSGPCKNVKTYFMAYVECQHCAARGITFSGWILFMRQNILQ